MNSSRLFTSTLLLTSALASGAAFAQQRTSDEIVVTAERREQNLQDVALAVSVITADQLADRGVSDIRDLQRLAVGVKVLEVGQQPSIFIRGVGNAVANFSQDPGASFNIDNVPIARPLTANAGMFDLERVEVLKGPQGTLYGRNATAGAINVVTRQPTYENGGSVDLRLGNFDLVQARLMGNAAFSDEFAMRVALQSETRSGYMSNGANDADSFSGRIRALWEPSSDFSLLATISFAGIGGIGPGDVPLKGGGVAGQYLYPSDPQRVDTNNGSIAACTGIPAQFCDGVRPGNNSIPDRGQRQELNSASYSLEANWDLGPVVLTAIPAYIDTSYEAVTYNGGFYQLIDSTDEQTSFETRLSSDGDGSLEWILGLFYMQDQQASYNIIHNVSPALLETNIPYLDLETYAAFGQGTLSLTDNMRLTLGLRYTVDRKQQETRLRNGNLAGVFAPPSTSFGDDEWSYLSYRVGLEFDLTEDNLLYFNASDGYKAGGINPGEATGPAGPASYEPEHLTSYQIGSRNEFANGRLIVNAEAWYWTWEDLQLFGIGCFNDSSVAAGPCGAGRNIGGVTRNSEEATNYGVELETLWRATDNDTFVFNVSYIRGQYEDAVGISTTPVGQVLNGQELTRTPEWSGLISYQHTWNLAGGGAIDATVTDQFSSSYLMTATRFIGVSTAGTGAFGGSTVEEDGWHSVSADLSYTSGDGNWTIALWGENLTDEDYTLFAGNTPAGFWGHPTPPQTYGIRLGAAF